jgi:hypothetical protein
VSLFYTYEIETATSEKEAGLRKKHDNAVLKMTGAVAMKLYEGMPYAKAAQLGAQAKLFATSLAILLRHVPTGHLDELSDPLFAACCEQLAMDPSKRPGAYKAICDVHMLAAIPGCWSAGDTMGPYQSGMLNVRGPQNVEWAILQGNMMLDRSHMWLSWAEAGFGEWSTGPKVGNEWDDWTPPRTPISRLWDKFTDEQAKERSEKCRRVLHYIRRGLKFAEVVDDQWRAAHERRR